VIILSSLLTHCSQSQKIRIACIPILSEEKWPDLILADEINTTLQNMKSSSLLVYPLDWTWDAIAVDSIKNQDYLIRYAKRIRLDYVLLQSINPININSWFVQYCLQDLHKNQSILQINDTLFFNDYHARFRKITQDVLDKLSIDSEPKTFCNFPSRTDWINFGKGRYAQLIGRLFEAEDAYKQVKDNPAVDKRLVSVLLDKAIDLESKGEFAEDIYLEAFQIISKNLKQDSSQTEYDSLLGRMYVQRSWWNKAEKTLSRAVQIDSNNPENYFYLSRLHSSRFKSLGFRNQEKLLKKAISINPAMEKAWIALGNLYYYQNNQKKAESVYQKLLSIHPTSLDGLLELGKIHVLKNDVIHIIQTYEKVLDLAPDQAVAYYNLGVAYYNDQKIEESKRFFKRAVALEDHLDSHYYLGVICQQEDQMNEAISHFRFRIRNRKGQDDLYAEEARKRLWNLLQKQEVS